MDALSFSAAELAWLLHAAGPPSAETLKVLGLTKAEMSEPVRNAGFSSLILRGEADTDGDEATIAPPASAVGQGIIGATTVVQFGFIADGEADGGLLFSSPKLRILIAPRAFDTYDALALDTKEPLGKPVAGLAEAFLEERNPGLAAVVVQGPGGSRQYTVAAGDDWTFVDGKTPTNGLSKTAALKLLREAVGSAGSAAKTYGGRGLKYDPQQVRDPEGQWAGGVPGAGFDMSGLTDVGEVEGSFGDLAMGLDHVGDVRVAFREQGKVREMDLEIEEVAEIGDVVERLAGERGDLPDDADDRGLYDDEAFGALEEGRVELYGNGMIAVRFGHSDPEPYVLMLDPGDPDNPDVDPDDAQLFLDAIDDIMIAADRRGFLAGGDP